MVYLSPEGCWKVLLEGVCAVAWPWAHGSHEPGCAAGRSAMVKRMFLPPAPLPRFLLKCLLTNSSFYVHFDAWYVAGT